MSQSHFHAVKSVTNNNYKQVNNTTSELYN